VGAVCHVPVCKVLIYGVLEGSVERQVNEVDRLNGGQGDAPSRCLGQLCVGGADLLLRQSLKLYVADQRGRPADRSAVAGAGGGSEAALTGQPGSQVRVCRELGGPMYSLSAFST
jgi:hypothetical protein